MGSRLFGNMLHNPSFDDGRNQAASRGRIAALLVFVLVCVFTLGMLSACGSEDESQSDSPYAGFWVLHSYQAQSDSFAVGPEDIQKMSEMGYSGSLSLNGDGSCVLDLLGSVFEGTWEDRGDKGARLTFEAFETDASLTSPPEGSKASQGLVFVFGDYQVQMIPYVQEAPESEEDLEVLEEADQV